MAYNTVQEGIWSSLSSRIKDYGALVKLRLNLTVVFSSIMAYLIIDTSGTVDWVRLGVLALGGFLVTGASNSLNQVLEKDYDALMSRTSDRPLAAGRMGISEAVMAAGFMALIGITLLALFNPWTAFLGTIAMVSYAFVYTPLKRISPAAVLVGAFPGALPAMIGCLAASGEFTPMVLVLFALQFFWQFPHFWSIGWLGFEDYQKAGYAMIPAANGKPDPLIGRQAFFYALMLIPIIVMPFWLGKTGWASLIVVVALSLGYIWRSWVFSQKGDRKSALGVMFYSFAYLPLCLISLFLDKI